MDWQPISTAPFDRELELAVVEGDRIHVLVFPCCRAHPGWVSQRQAYRWMCIQLIGVSGLAKLQPPRPDRRLQCRRGLDIADELRRRAVEWDEMSEAVLDFVEANPR